MSSLRDLLKAKTPPVVIPVAELVLAPDDSLKVNSKDRVLSGGGKTDRFQRNLDFGRPAFLIHVGLDFPRFVPALVNDPAFLGDQRIVLGPSGVNSEQKSVSVVVEGVQDDGKTVIIDKAVIPPQLCGQNSLCLAVKASDSKVKVLVVVKG